VTLDLQGLHWGLLALALSLLAAWRLFASRPAVLRFSHIAPLREATSGQRSLSGPILRSLRILTLLLLILAVLRPRAGHTIEELLSPGVDIVVTLDLSASMKALDMGGRSREAVAKEVVARFVRSRTHDRVGLVVFAGRAFTQAPLTTDYGLLERLVDSSQAGTLGDGTAIGMGLATALSRLRDSEAKSKLIVLVTDGRSNTGRIGPTTAADLAKTLGIRIYSVGVASHGRAPMPMQGPFGQTIMGYIDDDLDDETLTAIARTTGGIYRRAADAKSLEEIFEEISNLEKTPVKIREHHLYQELYLYLVLPALALLLLEILLAHTRFLRIP
jgi:Ca-activated chloride channel family protein